MGRRLERLINDPEFVRKVAEWNAERNEGEPLDPKDAIEVAKAIMDLGKIIQEQGPVPEEILQAAAENDDQLHVLKSALTVLTLAGEAEEIGGMIFPIDEDTQAGNLRLEMAARYSCKESEVECDEETVQRAFTMLKTVAYLVRFKGPRSVAELTKTMCPPFHPVAMPGLVSILVLTGDYRVDAGVLSLVK